MQLTPSYSTTVIERRSSSASAHTADNRRGSRKGPGKRTSCRVWVTTGFSLWRRVRVRHRSYSEMTFPPESGPPSWCARLRGGKAILTHIEMMRRTDWLIWSKSLPSIARSGWERLRPN